MPFVYRGKPANIDRSALRSESLIDRIARIALVKLSSSIEDPIRSGLECPEADNLTSLSFRQGLQTQEERRQIQTSSLSYTLFKNRAKLV